MRAFVLALCSAWLLAACALPTAAPDAAPDAMSKAAPLAQRFFALRATEGGRLYRIDAARSRLHIHVFRAGRAAHLGHNHVLSAPKLEGFVLLPEQGPGAARIELEFRLDELALDEPELRAALGPAWASAMSAEAIVATRANMLGQANLQAEAFPVVRIRSLRVAGEPPKLAAEVEIELHGQRRSQWLALQADVGSDGLSARGALVLRQSDFGIRPFSVLGGLLAVQDELMLEFTLYASPSNGITSTNSPAATSP
jgi:hypothetical protein